MRRFLLLTTRADDHLAAREREAFGRLAGLGDDEVEHVRLEQGPFLPERFDRWGGVVLGGSPFTVSDPPETKSAVQVRVEAELAVTLRRVVEADVPYLGLCYGVGATSLAVGGVVDRQFGEPVGTTTVHLTDAGRADPVFAGLPHTFDAFVGHKEACSRLPEGAVLLATSGPCPVQAYRLGTRQYVTQFHPELEPATLVDRIHAYAHHGYFDPGEAETLVARAEAADVSHSHEVLRAFVARFG